MRKRLMSRIAAILVALAPVPALPDQVWVLLEHAMPCDEEPCSNATEYLSYPMNRVDPAGLRPALQALQENRPAPNDPASSEPRFCRQSGRGHDPDTLPVQTKSGSLKGLPAVFIDTRKLKGPEGYEGLFGPELHAQIVRKFQGAGLKVLLEAELEMEPGLPSLNLRFSPPRGECDPYRVSLSLSQTAVLTRDVAIRIEATTWSGSGGAHADHPDADEFDAAMRLIDAFLLDWSTAQETP